MHIRARRDRLCTRKCITDRNGTVAAAVTLCFVPNQACNNVIDDLEYHATYRITRPKVFACYSRRLLRPTIADFVVALSFCSSCLHTVVCTKCETGFVVQTASRKSGNLAAVVYECRENRRRAIVANNHHPVTNCLLPLYASFIDYHRELRSRINSIKYDFK